MESIPLRAMHLTRLLKERKKLIGDPIRLLSSFYNNN